MAVTITFSGKIDEVLFEIRQLAAHHGLLAAAAHDWTRPVVTNARLEAEAAEADAPELAANTGNEGKSPIPVEQRVQDAIASAPKRHRRTKAEMEAARAAEAAAASVSQVVYADGAQTPAVGLEAAYPDAVAEIKAAVEAEQFVLVDNTEGEVAEQPPATFDDAKEALKKILETEGLGVEAGRALLTSFGIKKMTELNPVEFGLFVAKANEKLGGAK